MRWRVGGLTTAAIALVTVSALILGLSPGLALMCGALGMIALDRYDPTRKFSSWIFKIAHNTALDQLRKKEPATLSIDGSPHARTSAEVEASTLTPESSDETPEEYTASRELGSEIEVAIGIDIMRNDAPDRRDLRENG